MMTRKVATVFMITAAAAPGFATPASAGGVGDFLSPAFGISCVNHHGSHAEGAAGPGTGAADGNLAGLPIGIPMNHCGGADSPIEDDDEDVDF